MNDIQNETTIIQVQAIEPTDWGCKLTAQDKKIYNVSKVKKDGSSSVAWQQMINMGIKGMNLDGSKGSTVEIWYREVPNKHGGTSRYIASFRETNGEPPVSTQRVESPRSEAPSASSGQSDDYWDRKAYKKCLWNYWLEKVALQDQQNWMDEVWTIFKRIEKDAEIRFNPSPLRQAVQKHAPEVTEELPTIQQEDEIPFRDDEYV